MTITRSEVLRRARAVWPYGSVPYSMEALHSPDGYRQDCSGYVSMCWALPTTAAGSWGGYNTATLVTSGTMFEIPTADLKPGDAVGLCGPGTEGPTGHVQLFTGWSSTAGRYFCLEQVGGASGPLSASHSLPAGYRAYRFRGIIDDPAPSQGDTMLTHWSTVMQGSTGAAVEVAQALLILRGLPVGSKDGRPDGVFGPTTASSTRAFQSLHGLTVDGIFGPHTLSVALYGRDYA